MSKTGSREYGSKAYTNTRINNVLNRVTSTLESRVTSRRNRTFTSDDIQECMTEARVPRTDSEFRLSVISRILQSESVLPTNKSKASTRIPAKHRKIREWKLSKAGFSF